MLPIRRLDPSDAPAFRTLRLRALREHPQAFTSSYEEDAALPLAATEQGLAGGDRCSWGGFDAGTLCAMAGLERESRAKARHKATLVGMYVAPEYADRGIGRELVETLIAAARDLGLESLVLTVTEGNRAATHLYQRCGFRSFGIEPRAIRVDGLPLAKNHMFLALTP